jgi:hypothetical protein
MAGWKPVTIPLTERMGGGECPVLNHLEQLSEN